MSRIEDRAMFDDRDTMLGWSRFRRTLGRGWLAGVLTCALAAGAPAQQLEGAPPRIVPSDVPVHSVLYESVEAVPPGLRTAPAAEHIQAFAGRGMQLRGDGKVLVEIIGPEGSDAQFEMRALGLPSRGVELGLKAAEIAALPATQSGQVTSIEAPLTAYENRVEAWLPSASLTGIARSLPSGYFIQEVIPPEVDDVTGEGPAAINSDSYESAGADGSGLTIAVIDGGYNNLSAAVTNGDAPSGATLINNTPNAFESGTSRHGTGCVEAAFDHAPGATWRIYKIDSLSDFGTVVTDAIDNGVDVISHSISRYNTGWADDTGTACSAANNASNNGILLFTSAGNRALDHYEGAFNGNGDDWHDFSTGDETINVSIAADTQSRGYYLSWSNSSTDLDFFLYDSTLTTVIASSTNAGAGVFEFFSFFHMNATATYHLAVLHKSGPTSTTIEIFSHNAGTWQQYAVASGSNTSPSNCTGSRVISVGAVDEDNYAQANGSTPIENYSSQGPSNSGMTLPDLSGPTDTTGFSYPGGFTGTSSATPNAAGATTAFWSANTNLNASGVIWLVKEQADLWRDWGASGNDNVYGKGGVQLIDYDGGTRWLVRSYPGTTDDGTVPYSTFPAAHGGVPNNGRILVWGGGYPETVTTSGKNLLVEQVPDTGSATLGQ
jgi:hypothetical protein